ncbi:MAG: TolC family protein [Bacteroidota bacterium]|jgi:outer membrane protein TolC|nr:TolC family protein [Ignavibacteria bacterium]MCU7500039.1 TolC family protein [Ignavibacteria bacterium]MCU7521995.1 TolC family protein [Ignavibacteria bacterium]MCU7525291.1 TolC family protein [Ignavibacteria bacterium]
MKILCYILLLTTLTSNFLSAQNNLQFYLSAALRNNPGIKEDMNNIEIKYLDRSLNNAQFNMPQVSITANYLFAPYFNNSRLITTAPDPEAIGYDPSITNGGLYSAQLNVTKNIFNSGLTEAYNSQTGLQILSSGNAIELEKHALHRDITEQYLASYQAGQLYYLSRALIDTIKQQLQITHALVFKGLVKETDYLLLKVELANQQIASDEAFSAFKTNLYQLNTACGIYDTAMVELQSTELHTSGPVNESNFLRQYSIDSMLIVSSQKTLETKYLPQLSIFANTGLNAVELKGIQRRFGVSAGLNFSYPLFDGGQKSITRQQSLISAHTIAAQRESQRITIRNKLNEVSGQLEVYSRSINAIQSQMKDYEQILRLSRSELMRGELTMVEFITIIRNFLELKKAEIQTFAGYQQALNQFNYWNW